MKESTALICDGLHNFNHPCRYPILPQRDAFQRAVLEGQQGATAAQGRPEGPHQVANVRPDHLRAGRRRQREARAQSADDHRGRLEDAVHRGPAHQSPRGQGPRQAGVKTAVKTGVKARGHGRAQGTDVRIVCTCSPFDRSVKIFLSDVF